MFIHHQKPFIVVCLILFTLLGCNNVTPGEEGPQIDNPPSKTEIIKTDPPLPMELIDDAIDLRPAPNSSESKVKLSKGIKVKKIGEWLNNNDWCWIEVNSDKGWVLCTTLSSTEAGPSKPTPSIDTPIPSEPPTEEPSLESQGIDEIMLGNPSPGG